MARSLIVGRHQLDVLLDHEAGSGQFRPELTDPEHANAASSVLWECVLLSKHYVPMVRRFAGLVSEGSRGVPGKLYILDYVFLNRVVFFLYRDRVEIPF